MPYLYNPTVAMLQLVMSLVKFFCYQRVLGRVLGVSGGNATLAALWALQALLQGHGIISGASQVDCRQLSPSPVLWLKYSSGCRAQAPPSRAGFGGNVSLYKSIAGAYFIILIPCLLLVYF